MSAREVYLAADPVNAEIVKDMLVDRGIPAHVRRQHLWGGMGELPANLYPGVWVEASLYDRARQLVETFEADGVARGPDWVCPGCRERIDGAFYACWRCQHARPDLD